MGKCFFVVLLKYIAPLELVDKYRAKHLEFVSKYYQKGSFLISGPLVPRNGGVIIAIAKDQKELESILEEDPFAQEKVAEFNIMQFQPTNCHPDDNFLRTLIL
jgi:uncharacterized protein YciI